MRIEMTEYRIRASLTAPLTLIFVSDLHGCDNEPLLAHIRDSGAQAVLVGGDYMHNERNFTRGFDFLRQSARLLPTFCVLGNHEMHYTADVRAATRETGAVLLDNEAVAFKGIVLGGLGTGYTPGGPQSRRGLPPTPDLSFLRRFAAMPGYKLLLSHHPEYWEPYIRPFPIDLTVSGHAHGGQWRFFGCGIFAPGQGIFPRYTSGLYEGRLLVGRGLGNPHVFPRIGNRPEMILLHLE